MAIPMVERITGKSCAMSDELLSIPSKTSYRFRRFRSATDTATDDYRVRCERRKNNDARKIEASLWFFTQPREKVAFKAAFFSVFPSSNDYYTSNRFVVYFIFRPLNSRRPVLNFQASFPGKNQQPFQGEYTYTTRSAKQSRRSWSFKKPETDFFTAHRLVHPRGSRLAEPC